MPIVTERVFLTVDTGDQAVELEFTQAVDSMMSLMRPWTSSMSSILRNRVKDGAIMRATEAVIRDRQGRGEITAPWFVRRVPPAPSAAVVAYSC